MITPTDLKNGMIRPDDLEHREAHTIPAGEVLTRSDGTIVRLLDNARAVLLMSAPDERELPPPPEAPSASANPNQKIKDFGRRQ